MDPITAAQTAAELAGIFLSLVKTTKEIIETMNGARESLLEILTRCERIRLNLELFRALTARLSDPVERSITLGFNESAYKQTANEVTALVQKVSNSSKHSDLWMKINWVYYKGDVGGLLGKLEEREKDLGFVLTFIAAQSSVITENEVLAMKARANNRAKVVDAFGSVQSNPAQQSNRIQEKYSEDAKKESKTSSPAPTTPGPGTKTTTLWPGNLSRRNLDTSYLKERDRLSDGAKWGNWAKMLSALETGERRFGENWVNAVRLAPTDVPKKWSLWTPLHQAAFMNAPEAVIRKLLERGAFKTIPTAETRGQFRYQDLTPVEIARELGYTSIIPILEPTVRHFIPARTVLGLEKHLHDLIRAEMADLDFEFSKSLRLPVLSVLTELEEPQMWLPVKGSRGFLFRLDGRELVVLSVGRKQADEESRRLFRVTEKRWMSIQDAVVFGY